MEQLFLADLEFSALRNALAQYVGADTSMDYRRYSMAQVVWNGDGAEIALDIHPPARMPAVVSCSEYDSRKDVKTPA